MKLKSREKIEEMKKWIDILEKRVNFVTKENERLKKQLKKDIYNYGANTSR